MYCVHTYIAYVAHDPCEISGANTQLVPIPRMAIFVAFATILSNVQYCDGEQGNSVFGRVEDGMHQ